MTHAVAEPHTVDGGKLLGRGSPGPLGCKLQQGGHCRQGAGLVDRWQAQVMEQAQGLRADDRDRDLLLAGPHRLGQPNDHICRQRFFDSQACQAALAQRFDRPLPGTVVDFRVHGQTDPLGVARHIDRQLRAVTENAPRFRHCRGTKDTLGAPLRPLPRIRTPARIIVCAPASRSQTWDQL